MSTMKPAEVKCENSSVVTHYAILIGIDDYPEKPLKSCVRDVQSIREGLESMLCNSLETYMLRTGWDRLDTTSPVENGLRWPTRVNVESAFKTVVQSARRGDFVYIHYSGHGTRKEASGDFANKFAGDLALVLLSASEKKSMEYLWGFELAHLLKEMIDHGLVVTLVLDCCFSGAVYRHDDPSVRFIPYNASLDSEDTSKPSEGAVTGLFRDASMHSNWLLNPESYAILAACGVYEEVPGLKFEGLHRGALSYCLLLAIQIVGVSGRHIDIHNHLCATFRYFQLPQNPVLYGNKDQGFFGQVDRSAPRSTTSMINRKTGIIELQAGHAHGVETGDQFELCPLDSASTNSRSWASPVMATVQNTRPLTSDLVLSEPPSSPPRPGWLAKARTRLALRKFPIKLADSIPLRQDWINALEEESLRTESDTDTLPAAFHVGLNDQGEYKIMDESQVQIINLPRIVQDQTCARQGAHILQHLARFRLAKDLRNGAPRDAFHATVAAYIDYKGKTFGPDSRIKAQNNDDAKLVVHNLGDKSLYVFVYNLGPNWQVQNVSSATYDVIGTQQNIERQFEMKIPQQMEEKGRSSCEDIIKVFVTAQPTSFELLELPRLGEISQVSRGMEINQDSSEEIVSNDWAAMNFFIYVVI